MIGRQVSHFYVIRSLGSSGRRRVRARFVTSGYARTLYLAHRYEEAIDIPSVRFGGVQRFSHQGQFGLKGA
jgi:hypothetical protein